MRFLLCSTSPTAFARLKLGSKTVPTATPNNAVGNSIASAVVAKWEGGLLSEEAALENAKLLDQEVASKLHEVNI